VAEARPSLLRPRQLPVHQTHIANATPGCLTPTFATGVLRIVAADWRVSGIIAANSGNWLTVTTTHDVALDGIPNQRVDQVRDNPYGEKTYGF
jgi:hypothetical protein